MALMKSSNNLFSKNTILNKYGGLEKYNNNEINQATSPIHKSSFLHNYNSSSPTTSKLQKLCQ